MNTIEVRIAFPDIPDADANEPAEDLLSELRQNDQLKEELNLELTDIVRDDAEAMDFGASLVAILGTPAIIILARAVKAWSERYGVDASLNGVRVSNVRSEDLADIIRAARVAVSKKERGA